jgi:DNA polymerase III delta prime subunit
MNLRVFPGSAVVFVFVFFRGRRPSRKILTSMALLHLESLPPKTTKGTLIRLLTQLGELNRGKIGRIEGHGRTATIEVPDAWVHRLVKALDGAKLGNQHIRAWHEGTQRSRDDEDHFARLLRLLEMEADAEADQARRRLQKLTPYEAEQAGASLIDLVLVDETVGLGGRCLVTLRKPDPKLPLPWTRLNVGSPVHLLPLEEGDRGSRGVVSRRTDRTIEIALAQPPDVQAERWRVDRSSNEVAQQRQRAALHRAAAARGERLAVLRDVLLGEQKPGFRNVPDIEPLEAVHNESQREAVQWSLSAEDVAIIHGPPGTGKTTTVVELIRQAVRRDQKVLACAPSNLAVDNMLERLLAADESAVRLGHPARVLPQLRDHTLDLMVEDQQDMRLARKLAKDAFALLDRADRFTRAKPEPGARRQQRVEARAMLDDARRLEAQVVQELLDRADVLCATLTGLGSEVLGQRMFDLVVVDEACQSTEPATWIALQRGHRVVLAGDHCQLPPTVISRTAADEGFDVSLLERIMQMTGGSVARQLTTQYRMNEKIMAFSSAEFYDGSLEADQSVREHVLAELDHVELNEFTCEPLMFIDTAGAGFDEEDEPDGESRWNRGEAGVIQLQINRLLEAGLRPQQLAVISPYAAQVRFLRQEIATPELEIDTVDGFQGREKEVVLISLVRSNSAGEIGFLNDTRRMNVALTRARRRLVVVGDSATIAQHPFYRRLIEYMEGHGAYRSVWEEGGRRDEGTEGQS